MADLWWKLSKFCKKNVLLKTFRYVLNHHIIYLSKLVNCWKHVKKLFLKGSPSLNLPSNKGTAFGYYGCCKATIVFCLILIFFCYKCDIEFAITRFYSAANSINWDQRNGNIAPFFTYEGEILVVSYVFLWKALVFIGSHKQFDCFSSVWLIFNVFSFMMLSEVREKERKICKKKEMSWKMKKFIVADSCWDDAMLDAVINPETPFTVTKNQKNDVVQ